MIQTELSGITSTERDLRKFGITMSVALALIGGFLLWRNHPSYPVILVLSAAFLGSGIAIPAVLRPVYKAWMALALVLGWFMTRVILSLVFFLVVVPIGLVSRLCGVRFLEAKDDRKNTYWVPYRKHHSYETQF